VVRSLTERLCEVVSEDIPRVSRLGWQPAEARVGGMKLQRGHHAIQVKDGSRSDLGTRSKMDDVATMRIFIAGTTAAMDIGRDGKRLSETTWG
jgi:hypothetical protein